MIPIAAAASRLKRLYLATFPWADAHDYLLSPLRGLAAIIYSHHSDNADSSACGGEIVILAMRLCETYRSTASAR
jgi:hypothetical protein